jgi:hypothetical protein
MVFLKVCLDVAGSRSLHASDQSFIERLGGVDSRVAKQVIQRDYFRNHRDVFARVQKHRDLGQLDSENGSSLDVETSTLHYGVLVPLLEMDDDLDALLLPDGANPEDRWNVAAARARDR